MNRLILIIAVLLISSCSQASTSTSVTASPLISSETPKPLPSATLSPTATPTNEPTATAEVETFRKPTLDNVEINERWTKDQFPVQPGTPDGGAYFNLGCISNEIITGKAEIMGPNGQGTGIWLLAGAECWYAEPGQDYAVLVPLALTDHQQTIIAGYAIKEYNPKFEEVMDTEEEWNALLESRGFTGQSHIFLASIITPRHDKGTNQGLGNEELGAVYTQELIEQFASGNGDPSILPFVVIDGVKYYVLPPFDIGMKTTINN